MAGVAAAFAARNPVDLSRAIADWSAEIRRVVPCPRLLAGFVTRAATWLAAATTAERDDPLRELPAKYRRLVDALHRRLRERTLEGTPSQYFTRSMITAVEECGRSWKRTPEL